MADGADRATALIRAATESDLSAVVALLATDSMSPDSEELSDPPADCYRAAFRTIEADPDNELWVMELPGMPVAGCLQLTFVPGLSYRAAWRAIIEGVRIDATQRSRGLGEMLIGHAVARARARGCAIVQLTTNKRRTDAHRFYERMGFARSHEGFKLTL